MNRKLSEYKNFFIKAGPYLLILLVCFAVFGISLKNDFVGWDDGINITENYHLHSEGALKNIWLSFKMPSFLPLTYSLFYLEYKLWGLEPFFFHLVNLFLHSLNGIFVFIILTKIFNNKKLPLLIALFWLIHPLRVEVVGWATEQKTLLSSLMFWVGIYFYLKYRTTKRVRYFSLLILSYILGLLSKLTVIFLPLTLLIWEWFDRKVSLKKIFLFIVLVGIGLAFTTVGFFAEETNLDPVKSLDLSFILHIFIALRSIVFYFIKTIFPVNLSAVYPLWNIQTVEPLYIVSLFIFIGISVFVFRSAKKNNNRILVFSWFGYILNILPVSGIVPIPYMVNSFVADRYSYIPGLFLAVFLITAAERIIKLLKISSKEIAIAVLIFLAGLSWQQAKAWKDTRTLWEYVLVLYPDCKNAHANLGTYYSNRNFLDKAFFHYQKAHNLSSEGALCNYNMGVIYGQLEDFKKAEAYYRTALEIKPQYPDALCNLGNALYRQGRMEEAVYYLNEALKYEHSPVIEKAVKVNFKLIEDYMKNINK